MARELTGPQIVANEIARAHEQAQAEDARRSVAARSLMNRAQRRAADREATS
jgi:hypothetical protein